MPQHLQPKPGCRSIVVHDQAPNGNGDGVADGGEYILFDFISITPALLGPPASPSNSTTSPVLTLPDQRLPSYSDLDGSGYEKQTGSFNILLAGRCVGPVTADVTIDAAGGNEWVYPHIPFYRAARGMGEVDPASWTLAPRRRQRTSRRCSDTQLRGLPLHITALVPSGDGSAAPDTTATVVLDRRAKQRNDDAHLPCKRRL